MDGISVRLLKACWAGTKEHIRRLFQACMEVGTIPGRSEPLKW